MNQRAEDDGRRKSLNRHRASSGRTAIQAPIIPRTGITAPARVHYATNAAHPHQQLPMPGQLFTNYFLVEGILHTAAWQESLSQPADFDAFRARAHALLENAANFHTINEASTEQELIRPLFDLLGWADYLPQQGSDRNEDIPDHLLFADAASKARPATLPRRPRRPRQSQLLRYLATADINSDSVLRGQS